MINISLSKALFPLGSQLPDLIQYMILAIMISQIYSSLLFLSLILLHQCATLRAKYVIKDIVFIAKHIIQDIVFVDMIKDTIFIAKYV
jgi:hypothetical protein